MPARHSHGIRGTLKYAKGPDSCPEDREKGLMTAAPGEVSPSTLVGPGGSRQATEASQRR